MLPGETVDSGAQITRCEFCGEVPKLDVYRSNAGYYIGYMCSCQPWSRESGYYKTQQQALKALDNGDYGRD